VLRLRSPRAESAGDDVGSRRIAVDAASANNASVISSWLNRLASNGTSSPSSGTASLSSELTASSYSLPSASEPSSRRGPASGTVGILTYVAEVGIADDPDPSVGESAPNERVL
jgi:hypothetical protein